jgi:hypothetical protein
MAERLPLTVWINGEGWRLRFDTERQRNAFVTLVDVAQTWTVQVTLADGRQLYMRPSSVDMYCPEYP